MNRYALLTTLLLAQPLHAGTITFDNDPDGWKATVGSFTAPDISATARTFVVNTVFQTTNPATAETDAANLGKRVCYSGSFEPLCSGEYYRGPASVSDNTTSQFWMLFGAPITGALFAENNSETFNIALYDLALTIVGSASQVPARQRPDDTFSFGFLSDAPFQILSLRQTQSVMEFATQPILPELTTTVTPELPTGALVLLGAALTWLFSSLAHRAPMEGR